MQISGWTTLLQGPNGIKFLHFCVELRDNRPMNSDGASTELVDVGSVSESSDASRATCRRNCRASSPGRTPHPGQISLRVSSLSRRPGRRLAIARASIFPYDTVRARRLNLFKSIMTLVPSRSAFIFRHEQRELSTQARSRSRRVWAARGSFQSAMAVAVPYRPASGTILGGRRRRALRRVRAWAVTVPVVAAGRCPPC
jgi:hypothetical protein